MGFSSKAIWKVDLKFKSPAGTSRGILYEKPSWIFYVEEAQHIRGECSVIPGLSLDYESEDQFENKIKSDDRFFVAGARGMAGSAICRALLAKGYGDKAKGGALLTPNRVSFSKKQSDSPSSCSN